MEQLERTMKQGAVNGCTGLEMIDEAKLHEPVSYTHLDVYKRQGGSSDATTDAATHRMVPAVSR